ncbi:PepSY-associated TM helix domain-containing protein [Sphingobacterium chungjuense]|uniref:PepSY-associated TM helix domain-containing protein n=1 Tax=Sphingobacterium chungjuense TaxID=2675553 RepID=UPI00140A7F85|nr:PepSY-associated TM helix domain-containing protein [Sphingobacterium chungjuense]
MLGEKKNKKKSFIKRWFGKLHLWFGLAVGIPVVIISITGALYVFKDEFENFTRRDVIYHHEPDIASKELIPISVLADQVEQACPEDYPLHWVNVPVDPAMSYQYYYYERNPDAWHYFDEVVIYKLIYVNPYSGEVLRVYDEKMGFFNIVKMIHFSFLLQSEWGKYVVGIPVCLFVFMLISGIVLWWPRNKAGRKQRFQFNWKKTTKAKRKNYDLHNILGFYGSIFALIFSITGLFYCYFVIQAFIYVVFSGGETVYPDHSHITTTAPESVRTDYTLDSIANQVKRLYPESYGFALDLGDDHLDDHIHPNFEVYVKHLSYSYHQMSQLIFDEHSAELLHTHDYKDKNFGEKMVGANYDIHVGSIFNLPTKIIAFLVSLICASLPVTGFMIWYNRKKKAI